jgi:hypothetical protein
MCIALYFKRPVVKKYHGNMVTNKKAYHQVGSSVMTVDVANRGADGKCLNSKWWCKSRGTDRVRGNGGM